MHIVYVTKEYPPSLRSGGIGSYVQEIASGMVSLGHKVTVITASDDTRTQSTELENGIIVIRLSKGDFFIPNIEPNRFYKKFRIIYRFHSYRLKIKKTIDSLHDVDIIEVADFGAEGLYLQKLGIPVVIRLHTPSFLDISSLTVRKIPFLKLHRSLTPKYEQRILKKAKYISSCSQALLNWLHDNVEFSPRTENVIANPLNINYAETIETNNLDTASIIIFYAGTISETKGVGDLVDACRLLRKEGRNVKLHLAGKEGEYAKHIKEEIKNKGEDWCIFLGKLDREKLGSYYHSAAICCFPSWWENLPMVCLEAMASEGLVIGSHSGGMKEIIDDGINGFLVPRRNPVQLYKVMKQILSLSDNERQNIKKNAKQHIFERFSSEKISSQMEKYFKKIIDDYKNHISL